MSHLHRLRGGGCSILRSVATSQTDQFHARNSKSGCSAGRRFRRETADLTFGEELIAFDEPLSAQQTIASPPGWGEILANANSNLTSWQESDELDRGLRDWLDERVTGYTNGRLARRAGDWLHELAFRLFDEGEDHVSDHLLSTCLFEPARRFEEEFGMFGVLPLPGALL